MVGKIGAWGEKIVAQWLQNQGWSILEQRWHCRWGEIDLITYQETTQTLAFVEVKTRSKNNWDKDGILAITPQKQAKIAHSAGIFLSQNPNLAELFCRFDVALVTYKKSKLIDDEIPTKKIDQLTVRFGEIVTFNGYQFILHKYLESAFLLP